MTSKTLIEQLGKFADAKSVAVERCGNGWVAQITDSEEHDEKMVFEYFDGDHDGQLAALCDLLKMVARRLGPFPDVMGAEAHQEIVIKVQNKK